MRVLLSASLAVACLAAFAYSNAIAPPAPPAKKSGPPPKNTVTHPPTEHGTPPPTNTLIHSVFDAEWDNATIEEHHHLKCGASFAVAHESICCNNIVTKIVDGKDECCGAAAYDPDHSLCCNLKIVPKKQDESCCGNTILYNHRAEICCDGKTKTRGANTGCCAGKPYSALTHLCCTNRLLARGTNAACCGSQPFDPLSPIQACCGDKKLFNPKYQFCCYGHEVTLTVNKDTCKPYEHFTLL